MARSRTTLTNWLTTRYKLIITNEENLKEVSSFGYTYAKVIVFLVLIFAALVALSVWLVTSVLSAWLDPRSAQLEQNKRLYELAVQIDSLEMMMDQKDQFITSFQAIITGKVPDNPYAADSSQEKLDSMELYMANQETDIAELLEVDSQFRESIESDELVEFTSTAYSENTPQGNLQEIFFFQPVQGVVSSPFNPKIGHFGTDIVAKKNEPVKAVADGTVVFSGWTQSDGYVVALQHRGNIISVYKHNAALMQTVGSFVNAGQVLAIVGNSGEHTSGPHLHLELWYKGSPVNPEDFIPIL